MKFIPSHNEGKRMLLTEKYDFETDMMFEDIIYVRKRITTALGIPIRFFGFR